MPQSYCASYFHFIFSTKDRADFIDTTWQQRLYDYIGGFCKSEQSPLLAAGGIADHIHLLISLNKELSVAGFMRELKANSSRWVHETLQKPKFAWQSGYGAFSVSHSNLNAVKTYIANQADHHKTRSFQEEFIELLERHQVPYDARYIWK